ncbi:MAG TPA: hypothetical protein VLF15_01735 [Pseudoxanthomonas sp.]|nr:hypothetical protein [Pseudoxanthomonas sp.]
MSTNPTRPQTVDWWRLLWDMVQHGHSLSEIGRKTGIAVMTIYGYRDGSQPPHWRGELLIELWCGVCNKARQDVPMTALVLTPRVVNARDAVQVTNEAAKQLEEVWRS